MNILMLKSPTGYCETLEKALAQIGAMHAVAIETHDPEDAIRAGIDAMLMLDVDLVAGSKEVSWLASHVGARTGVPFVALDPVESSHPALPMAKNGCGLVLVSETNKKHLGTAQLIDSIKTHYSPRVLPDSILKSPEELSVMINEFRDVAGFVYGFGES